MFEGQEIFKRAVVGMSQACETVLKARGLAADDVDLVVPHQANLRIIEAVVKRAGIPMERCFVNIQRYGNMSSATVPVALVEALEEGRVAPGCNLLLTGFGAGLTWSAHVRALGRARDAARHERRGTAAVRQRARSRWSGLHRRQARLAPVRLTSSR